MNKQTYTNDTVVVRRSRVIPQDERLDALEDAQWMDDMEDAGRRVVRVLDIESRYYIHGQNTTAGHRSRMRNQYLRRYWIRRRYWLFLHVLFTWDAIVLLTRSKRRLKRYLARQGFI